MPTPRLRMVNRNDPDEVAEATVARVTKSRIYLRIRAGGGLVIPFWRETGKPVGGQGEWDPDPASWKAVVSEAKSA